VVYKLAAKRRTIRNQAQYSPQIIRQMNLDKTRASTIVFSELLGIVSRRRSVSGAEIGRIRIDIGTFPEASPMLRNSDVMPVVFLLHVAPTAFLAVPHMMLISSADVSSKGMVASW